MIIRTAPLPPCSAALLSAPVRRSLKSRRQNPRATDGKPDLSGVWITGLQLLIGRRSAQDPAGRRRRGTTRCRRPSRRAVRAEAEKQRQYSCRGAASTTRWRVPHLGVPRITTRPLPFQIIQMKDQVLIL
jgi:hypothetical protein